MDIPILEKLNTNQRSEAHIRVHYPEFYNLLCNKYPNLEFREKLYWYYNNLTERPVCRTCHKEVKFINSTVGYATHCSLKCRSNDPDVINKMRSTNIEKYGVTCSLYNEEIKKKKLETWLDKYGVDNPAKSDIIKERSRNTFLRKYGVVSPLLNEEVRKKSIQTKIERYGSATYTNRSKGADTWKKKRILKGEVLGYTEDGYQIRSCPHPECNKCNEKSYIIPGIVYCNRLGRCEVCTNILPLGNASNKNTSIEIFVRNILDKYNITYITNDRKVLGGKELDIYIPSHKLGIECNGVYWHSQYPKEYHYNKFMSCKEKGIQLVTVWEDQILNDPERIEYIILSKLGIYEKRLYARECSVHLVDSPHCREFLDCYHLQGSVNSSVRLGLYYNDELISVMTFGKGRKCLNSKDEWELYRYCCKSEVQVVGGASKLFKYFINNYHPNSIVSFSSNDISDGSLYKVLGFKEVSHNIGYWYIKNNIRYHRLNFIKQRLVKEGYDPNMTESEIMSLRGYYKIYDSGQTKWIYTT